MLLPSANPHSLHGCPWPWADTDFCSPSQAQLWDETAVIKTLSEAEIEAASLGRTTDKAAAGIQAPAAPS